MNTEPMAEPEDGAEMSWDGKNDRRRPVSPSSNEVMVLSERLHSLHSDVSEIKAAMHDLASAITKLALIEERQQLAVAALERVFTAQAAIEKRVLELEKVAPANLQTNHWAERLILLCAGAAVLLVWNKVTKGL